jgi:hypothetical protein
MPANKDTWEAYKLKIKDKRCKKGKALPTGKGLNSEDLILQKGETVVQSLIAEVAGKAQKYNRYGQRKFVSFVFLPLKMLVKSISEHRVRDYCVMYLQVTRGHRVRQSISFLT